MIQQYLKERIQLLSFFVIVLIIFGLVFYLYHLPFEHYVYASFLILLMLATSMIYDYIQFSKKHHIIKELEKNTEFLQENLPPKTTQNDEDYQKIITHLITRNRQLISRADEKHTNLIEYYTLWTHQIKTPLSAMDFLIQGKSRDVFDDMELQIMNIESYIDMALQYLRIDNMSSDLKLLNYSIKEIVNEAIKDYSKMFIYKGIKLELALIELDVITDEKWLLFVIKQILSNAIKYTPKGKIRIYAKDKHLYIEDSGIGIQAEDIVSVFNKGFTGYNGRINRKSTGLGLYLVKEIVDNLGHSIEINSLVDEGTIVSLNLSQENLRVE